MPVFRRWIATGAVLAALTGCGWGSDPGPEAPAVVLTGERATAEQAAALAKGFVDTLAAKDAAGFAALADLDGLVALSVGDRQLMPGFLGGFTEGVSGTSGSLYTAYRRLLDSGASLRPLGTRTDADGAVYGVVGVIFANGGFNQIHLRARTADGHTRWVDVWTLADGRGVSDTLSDSLDQVLLQEGLLDPEGHRQLQALRPLVDRTNAGDPQGVLDAYERAGPQAQGLRMAKQLRLAAATALQLDPAVHQQIIEDFKAAFPDDPAIRVQQIDLLALQGKHVEAARVIEQLNEDYPDPYLLVMAAGSYLAGNDADAARTTVDAALAADPTLLEGWVQLVLVSSLTGDERAVGRGLTELSGVHGVKPAMFEDDPAWANLRAMSVYRPWAASAGG